MKLFAFAVFDAKAEAYMRPFFAEAIGMAVRSFADAVADESSPMGKHPEDYTLFKVGSFDQLSGLFEQDQVPVPMGTALSFKASENGRRLSAVGAS